MKEPGINHAKIRKTRICITDEGFSDAKQQKVKYLHDRAGLKSCKNMKKQEYALQMSAPVMQNNRKSNIYMTELDSNHAR